MLKTRRDLCLVATLALTLGAAAGCKKSQRQVPPGPSGMPANGRRAALHANPHANMHAMPSDHPGALRGVSEMNKDRDNPHGTPAEMAPPVPTHAAGGGSIRGGLAVSDKVKAKVQAGQTIFLVVRQHTPIGVGPVLAAKRLTVGAWPQPFEITDSDVMISGMQLQGRVVVSARVDQDGDAMTKSVGDVEGASPPVDLPAAALQLTLDTVRTQEAGAPSPANLGGGFGGGGMPPGHP